MNHALRILRPKAVLQRTGDSRSPLYDKAARGLFTKPIKLGMRASGWPEHEVNAIVAARIAGESDDAIRALVKRLHAMRSTMAQAGA